MSNHSFDIHIATEYKSVDVAVLAWHFQYWIMKNKRLKRNFIEQRTWTYQTIQEIAAAFPYWSIKQVERLINKAIALKILKKGNFNKSKYDRTVWYAFENEEKFSISRFREMENTESGNGYPEIGKPIPDTIPYTLTNREREEEAAPPALTSSFFGMEEIGKNEGVVHTVDTPLVQDIKNPKIQRNSQDVEHKVNYQTFIRNYEEISSNNLNTIEDVSLKNETKSSKKPKKEAKPKKEVVHKIAYRENILLTEGEYEKLLKQYGEEKVNALLDFFHIKKASKGYEYKSDYHTLLPGGWVNKQFEKDQSDPKVLSKNSALENYNLSRRIKKKFCQRDDIYVYDEFIEFHKTGSGGYVQVIPFGRSDHESFKEKVEQELAKRGLSFP